MTQHFYGRALRENNKKSFDENLKQKLVDLFSELSLAPLGDKIYGYNQYSGNDRKLPETLAQNRYALEEYLGILEVHLRLLYTSGDGNVPESHLPKFIEVWEYLARFETATMGGTPHDGFPYSKMVNPAFLLEIPTSRLIGWSFGDVSSLGFFIPPQDLERQDFTNAWGDVLN